MTPIVLPHEYHGAGREPVIVVHGWFQGRTEFQPMTPYLDRDSFTYAFVDLRGYGEAGAITGTYSMTEVAYDVLALADHLGWRRFSVVGHSMGGKAAQLIAALAGPRVRRIVGVSPVQAEAIGFAPETAQLFARAVDDPQARRAIIDWSTGGRLPARWVDDMVRRSLESVSRAAFRAYLPAWGLEDLRERINGCRVPALAIVGAQDPDLNADVMRKTWLHTFPRGELVEIVEAGHYSMQETPLILVSLIEKFLSQPDPE